MIVRCDHGLCNRFEVLFSHLSETENETLTFIWRENPECNGKFLDYFEPINGVEFISEPLIENQGWRRLMPSAYQCIKDNLRPKSFVMERIAEWKKMLGSEYVAIHVRRTDNLGHILVRGKITSMETYFKEVDSLPNLPLFLAADECETQRKFERKYGKRVRFTPITPSSNLRQTTLLEAIVDLYVCVGAKHFVKTQCSSFSRVISILREEKNPDPDLCPGSVIG